MPLRDNTRAIAKGFPQERPAGETTNAAASADIAMRSKETLLWALAILLSALLPLGVLYAKGFSMPYQDDYHAILVFSIDYLHSHHKFLTFIAAQHNEYKLAFEHAVVILDLAATHHLNFALLTFIGTLFLPLTGYLLWRMELTAETGLQQRLVAFLPISLLFFSLTYCENMDWTMTTLQNLPVVFFSLLAIQLLVRSTQTSDGRKFLLACLSAALAAWTSANGFFLAPIGFCFLVWRRKWWRAITWGLVFVLPLLTYLYHYQRSIEVHGTHPMLKRAEFFIGFFGGVIPRPAVACLFGLLVIGVLLLAWRKGFALARPDIACFTAWLVLTDAVAAWVRGAASPIIPSRYSMYSLLFVIVAYAFLDWSLFARATPVQRRRYHACAILLGQRQTMVLRGIELYRADPAHQSPMIDPAVDKMFPWERGLEQKNLSEAIREGIYRLPPPASR
jgi:hypothetical protein